MGLNPCKSTERTVHVVYVLLLLLLKSEDCAGELLAASREDRDRKLTSDISVSSARLKIFGSDVTSKRRPSRVAR